MIGNLRVETVLSHDALIMRSEKLMQKRDLSLYITCTEMNFDILDYNRERVLHFKLGRADNFCCDFTNGDEVCLARLRAYRSGEELVHYTAAGRELQARDMWFSTNLADERNGGRLQRFHDLGEFDEDKRSCRRRLAGHNQRRRKHVPILPTLVHCPMQFVAPSSYGGQLTIGHGIHRPSMHFNTSGSKPTRTGYDSSVSGCAVASSGLVPFNSEPPMPSFPSVAYERQPYSYNVEPVRQRLPLDHGYSDDGSEAGNSFGTSNSERVLSVFCQGDETGSQSTMLHLH